MTDVLLLFAIFCAFGSAVGWLFAYQEISKSYRLMDDRSAFDVNLQTTILRHLFSRHAADKLGVTPDQVTVSRVALIVGIFSQIVVVALLATRY
jgi:hypothetical protein